MNIGTIAKLSEVDLGQLVRELQTRSMIEAAQERDLNFWQAFAVDHGLAEYADGVYRVNRHGHQLAIQIMGLHFENADQRKAIVRQILLTTTDTINAEQAAAALRQQEHEASMQRQNAHAEVMRQREAQINVAIDQLIAAGQSSAAT